MQFVVDIGLALLYFAFFLLLCAWAWRFWMMYVQQKALNKIDWLLLEIKLPREIFKSPYAAELAIAPMLQAGGLSGWYKLYFMGAMPAYASLEIASIEGTLHFYVRIQKKYKALVESNFYSQYPGIEIVEADDYTKMIRYHHLSKDVMCWGASYGLTKNWVPTNPKTGMPFSDEGGLEDKPKDKKDEYKMPADFLPIKTYVDYGLDKDPKEEFKIDPLGQILETMGSIGKGEYFWYQVIIQDEAVYNGTKRPKFYLNKKTHDHISLSEMANDRKKQIRTAGWKVQGQVDASEFGVPNMIDSYNEDYEQQFKVETDKDGKVTKTPIKVIAKHLETKPIPKKEMELTQDEKDEIEEINMKLSKALVMATVRLVYVTKKEKFNGQHVNTIVSFPKPFTGTNSLGMKALADPYDYPWQNFMNRRVPWRTEEIFEAYVEREAFFPHAGDRDTLDKWEDTFFWTASMKSRKIFRMIYEAIFYPFDHPQAKIVSTYNIEEIATLWHLPGATVATPTLPRIDSNKGVAPINLPL